MTHLVQEDIKMTKGIKENIMMELNMNDMENVCGSGVINGFYNPYSDPLLKRRKGNTRNEKKDQ